MKGLRILCFILSVSWFGVLPSLAADGRERSQHIPTGEMLEFSLLHLKESLQEIKQKNDRLTFENTALYDDIRYLQRVLQRLVARTTELGGESPSFHDQNNQELFMETVEPRGREQRTKDLITVFKRDISDLEKEIQFLEGNLDQNSFDSEKRLLLERKQKGLNNISELEKKFKILVKRSRVPEKTIESLKNEKRALEEKIGKPTAARP
jgi:hypothetical protein